MHAHKSFIFLLAVILIIIAGFYFSGANRASRAYQSMLKHDGMDLQVIDAFIKTRETHDQAYYQALNLAAVLDDRYLEEVLTLYAGAQMMLKNETAERILSLLPSKSIMVNTAAGRIMSGSQVGYEDPKQAARLLENSALRGDKVAAKYLSDLYYRFNCPIGATNWAKVANERVGIAVCDQIVIDSASLRENDWQTVVDNEQKIKNALDKGTIPVLEYSANCALNP